MSEIPSPPDPSDTSSQDPVNPETNFMLAKTVQLLVSSVGSRVDPRMFEAPNQPGISAFDYESRNKFFGPLEAWDGHFFSFQQQVNDDPRQQLILRVSLDPSVTKAPPNTVSHLQYLVLGQGEKGSIFTRTVAFCAEGPSQVQDKTWGDPAVSGNMINISDWRDLSQAEGEALLQDFADLSGRLNEYVSSYPDAVFYSEQDYRDD